MSDAVVHIILERTSATCPHSINHFLSFDGAVWSSARIGLRVDPFSALRRRPTEVSPAPSADTSCICRQCANIRLVSSNRDRSTHHMAVCLCQRGLVLDGVEPNPSQPVKDRGPLMLIRSASALDSVAPTYCRHDICLASRLSPGPWSVP